MSKLNKMDMFGVAPKLGIDNDFKYQTKFGAILTMLLSWVICVAAWVYGNDLYFRENPNSIYTEESTEHPERFKIDKNSLNFW